MSNEGQRTTGTLSGLSKHFSDENSARTLLERLRWPDGPACPNCGGDAPYRLNPKPSGKNPARQGLYKCRACRRQFSSTTGTIFEASHIPLSKWLLAIHLLSASKKGMSAHQLHRMLDVTYRSAWFMAHRLRYAMSEDGTLGMFSGVVEADETFVGGRRRLNRRGDRAMDNKTPVVALVERGTGRVRAVPMPRVTADNIGKMLERNVKPSATLMTDENAVYRVFSENAGMRHESVNHSKDEYVRGNAHSNTVEGFFSLLKRGINGTFHHVSSGHLGRYCDEFSFRYTRRKMSDGARAADIVKGADGKRLTYRQPSQGASTARA